MEEKPKRKNREVTGERRKYIRYSCKTELKAIIDFNTDVALRTFTKLPPIVFRRGEAGTVLNLSLKGLSLELEHFLPKGMMIKIAIDNPITPPIETDARVVWSKKPPKKSQAYTIGMAFRHMKDKHKRNLEKLIDFLKGIPE